MADIICRWRNGTPQTLVELVNSLPHKTMPNNEFRSFMNNSIWGPDFFRTPYQLACQLGLYFESDDGYYYPRFDHDIDVQEAQEYLEFWIPRYYVPNPYVGRNGFNSIECPTYMLSELYNYARNNPNCTYTDAYRSVFHEEANNNNDIVRNYINNFSKVLRFEKNGVLTITDINPNTVFDFMDRNDKKGFFDNFTKKTKTVDVDNLPLQQIFYGAPGTGKSNAVKRKTGELLENGDELDLPNVFRTTFHPDTDYASFVGCYKPTMKPTSKEEKTLTGKDEEIVYEFVPQVFTDAYVYAYTTKEPTYLVIEEINRGNCAQIFGDLFQLLDRKGGVSEYKIKADKDLAQYLREELGTDSEGIQDGKLCLPANLHILATMNTSDQSLFPMDSAFKRRWEWEYVPINYDTSIKSGKFEITIGKETDERKYSWVGFIEKVNEKIFDLTQSEDKQMGNFFIKQSIDEKGFKSKVMFYLWYEVLRDETENNKYFFYKKTTVDGKEVLSKFTFKDLFGDNETETLQQFMEYLEVASK